MSKPINPLDGVMNWLNRPSWARQVYEGNSVGRYTPITLDDQFMPWCKLTTVHKEAIKDAYEEGYQIWIWDSHIYEWQQLTECPIWWDGLVYAVGELREEFREPEEEPEEEAKFKLFMIDYFNEDGPWQACSSLSVGCVLGVDSKWQIFGYTDDDDWIDQGERTLGIYGVEAYVTEPCDHISNRKYAIGRKVK